MSALIAHTVFGVAVWLVSSSHFRKIACEQAAHITVTFDTIGELVEVDVFETVNFLTKIGLNVNHFQFAGSFEYADFVDKVLHTHRIISVHRTRIVPVPSRSLGNLIRASFDTACRRW